jgi:hypothetical protein
VQEIEDLLVLMEHQEKPEQPAIQDQLEEEIQDLQDLEDLLVLMEQ